MSSGFDFYKRIIYSPIDDDGSPLITPILPDKACIEKVASRQDLFPKVAEFIDGLKPEKGHRYVLINALGAGEYYGSNKNGDFFPEEALKHAGDNFGHKTFLKAGVFKHHINKDMKKSAGVVPLSEYNPGMHRVELIVKYSADKDPSVIEMIDNGELFPVSMGCRVPSDYCSICNNESKTTKDYCEHLQPGSMNSIIESGPDMGKRACALNLTPRFFDISRVIVGADRTARSYGKVASAFYMPEWVTLPSGLIAEKCGDYKDAAMIKRVEGVGGESTETALSNEISRFKETKDIVSSNQKKIKKNDLKKVSMCELPSILSSFASLGIPLSKEEFQYVTLQKLGRADLAEGLHKLGCVFLPSKKHEPIGGLDALIKISEYDVDPFILKVASQYLESRSVRLPFALNRVLSLEPISPKTLQKCASEVSLGKLNFLSVLYTDYLNKLAQFGPDGLRRAEMIPEVQSQLISDMDLIGFEKDAEVDKGKIGDLVVGCLLSPNYKVDPSCLDESASRHWKLAHSLDDLTPGQVRALHPNTSAWLTVIQTNGLAQDWVSPKNQVEEVN
jgi:hypothetical protein